MTAEHATLRVLAHLEKAATERIRAKHVKIPPYPAVASRLQQLVAGKRHNVDQIVKLVTTDAALTAAVLGRGRSAASGGAAKGPTSLAATIARIGDEEVVRLALAVSIGSVALAPGPLAALRRDTWRTALISARIAQELALRRGVQAEEAFLAGLLHDFGSVVVIACLEDIGREHNLPGLPEAAWRQLVEKLHVEFGLVVAARWNLPEALVDVMAAHHTPQQRPTPLVQLIAVVDKVIAILDRAPGHGVAALLQVGELSTDERFAIANAMPQILELMASYETGPSGGPSWVAPAAPPEDGWAVAFKAAIKTEMYSAQRITPDVIMFTGPSALPPNWLAQIVLHCEPERVDMLANIVSCDQRSKAEFAVTAKPFALGGPAKQAWMFQVDKARRGLEAAAPAPAAPAQPQARPPAKQGMAARLRDLLG